MPKTAKSTTASGKGKSSTIKVVDITSEQREKMIAEAAYYLAEQRNFEGGDTIQDWLQAEIAIDSSLH
jgi:hypothetical protein